MAPNHGHPEVKERTESITEEELVTQFREIRVASVYGRRSPHKPLLLLLALGRSLNDDDRLMSFEEIEDDLKGLISRFGLPHSSENAHYPFWRLRNDEGLWEIDRPDLVRMTSAGHAYISDLKRHQIFGGIPRDILEKLNGNAELFWKVVRILLDGYFPPSLHQDVLQATGLDGLASPSVLSVKEVRFLKRDRRFREDVLRAYDYQCALCEFAVRVDNQSIGLEAAHIRWHTAHGPARIRNGLALCVLHHKLFDEGVFTLLKNLHVLVDPSASGQRLEESLGQFNGSKLSVVPGNSNEHPAHEYLEWHRTTVFRLPELAL